MTDDLSSSEAALCFAAALRVIGRMEEAEFEERPPSSAIPRDIMSSGEAMLLIPLSLVLLARAYPLLMDEDALMDLLRDARLDSVN